MFLPGVRAIQYPYHNMGPKSCQDLPFSMPKIVCSDEWPCTKMAYTYNVPEKPK